MSIVVDLRAGETAFYYSKRAILISLPGSSRDRLPNYRCMITQVIVLSLSILVPGEGW